MKRAYNIKDVMKRNYPTLDFEGKWRDACGIPADRGTWVIYGKPKNGKTSLCMQLVKYLASNFGKVYYNSYEEGLSLSIMEAYRRVRMYDLKASSVMMVREEYEELIERLQRPASPRFVFIDSIQFLDLTVPQYKKLKELFPTKVFVFVSHMEGIGLQGATAKKIEKDASILMHVDHIRMLATGRYGGGTPYTINEERARKYWGEL